jgi:hypothetical protein
MTTDFLAERAELLEEGNFLAELLRETPAADLADVRDLRDRKTAVFRRYLELLPELPLARSPGTGKVLWWKIDTGGLDGWYWRYDAAQRKHPEPMPRDWLAMNGAMRLAEPVEHPPFQVFPGPGAPFVVPRLLTAANARAVIAEVPVGAHTGWAITYFAANPKNPKKVGLVNEWGSNRYDVYDDAGTWRGWDASIETLSDYDFDLTRWLRSGRLLWIAPGDESATLREGPDGCPYADLPGERRHAYVQNGEVLYG